MGTTAAFIEAFNQGLLCLHPTDTLVGLTCRDCHALCTYKQRPANAGYVHLATDCDTAYRYWQPLPTNWQARLAQLWPAPLTVVWRALNPTQQGAQDGMLAIRVPRLAPQHQWFANCLSALPILPSTSVNRHRETPLSTAAAVARLKDDKRVHVPAPLSQDTEDSSTEASTLIKLHDDGSWTLLRQGAYLV